jgi:hypothetical protein
MTCAASWRISASFWIFAGENTDLGVSLDRLGEVLGLAVERHRHGLLARRL